MKYRETREGARKTCLFTCATIGSYDDCVAGRGNWTGTYPESQRHAKRRDGGYKELPLLGDAIS